MARERLPDHFPYHPGVELIIRQHVPPQPFGESAFRDEAYPRPEARDPTDDSYKERLEWTLKFPPIEAPEGFDVNDAPPILNPIIRSLHILDQLQCVGRRAAQVVRCYLDDDEDKTFIAKIYDSVYSRPRQGDFTYSTDKDYACEAAAYDDIDHHRLGGRYTPNFLGTWTFDLPVPGRQSPLTRSVRMILLEEIKGRSMYSIMKSNEKTRFPPETRLGIIARIYEIYSKLQFFDVDHQDMAPRNVMLSGIDFEAPLWTKMPKVYLIDFGRCKLPQRTTSLSDDNPYDLPVDPKCYLFHYCSPIWGDWVPNPHRLNPAAWRGWVRRLFRNTGPYSVPNSHSVQFDYSRDFVELPPQPDPVAITENGESESSNNGVSD